MTFPKCDQCDKPATGAARDVLRTDNGTAHWDYAPLGDWKYGCADHPVTSDTHTSQPFLSRGLAESLRDDA